jgi:hypothetical protein
MSDTDRATTQNQERACNMYKTLFALLRLNHSHLSATMVITNHQDDAMHAQLNIYTLLSTSKH